MPIKPTDEQREAVARFETGDPLKISAFAGTGKTSTLRLLAETRPSRGLYIAFNKAIATEAKHKFPKSVDCRTTHSLAFRPISGQCRFSTGKMTTSLHSRQLAEAFKLEDRTFGRIKLDRLGQAFLALGTVRRFCQSQAPEIAEEHVPRYGRLAGANADELAKIRAFAVETGNQLWARMTDRRDQLPLGHDGYLKLWALQEPRLAADYILLDEAQDSNPVVLGVLALQEAQLIYVGDRHQQIYEWRGAVNAMDKIQGCSEAHLTQSFRFGPEIAAAASAVIAALGEKLTLVGNPLVKSTIGPVASPAAILARTNAGVMSEVIEALDRRQAPHVVGGVKELLRLLEDVVSLKKGEAGLSPEFFGFGSWAEVLEFVEQEEGESLRMFVQLVERFGERHLLWAMRRVSNNEKDADLIISTAHKAKGREWDTVRLSPDFASSRPDKPLAIDDAECRLFYVAMTRAKHRLDVAPETLATFMHRDRAAARPEHADRRAAVRPRPIVSPPPIPRPVREVQPPPPPRRVPPPLPSVQDVATPRSGRASAQPPATQQPRQGIFRKIANLMRRA